MLQVSCVRRNASSCQSVHYAFLVEFSAPSMTASGDPTNVYTVRLVETPGSTSNSVTPGVFSNGIGDGVNCLNNGNK